MEIEITPAGKSAKRLSLLSGGEKSMTALAFLFAVFLAARARSTSSTRSRPRSTISTSTASWRCCAATADRAQFIVITHQKRTMEAADWLFGVSMGGDGVSKVLSRRLPRRETDAPEAPRSPRSPERRRCYRRAARGARLERSVHHRRGRRDAARPSPPRPAEKRRGVFRRLRESLAKTRQALGCEIQATLFGALDEHTWERLEEALIMADVGASTTASVVATLEAEATAGELEGGEALSERLIELLAETARVGDGRIDVRTSRR